VDSLFGRGALTPAPAPDEEEPAPAPDDAPDDDEEVEGERYEVDEELVVVSLRSSSFASRPKAAS